MYDLTTPSFSSVSFSLVHSFNLSNDSVPTVKFSPLKQAAKTLSLTAISSQLAKENYGFAASVAAKNLDSAATSQYLFSPANLSVSFTKLVSFIHSSTFLV